MNCDWTGPELARSINMPVPIRHLPRSHRLRSTAGLCLLGLLVPMWSAAATELEQLLRSEQASEQLAWGQRYEHGEGVERSADAAVMLYCRAAETGLSDAQYRLGWMYANGRGVARDDALAAAWFTEAASNGDEHARRMLVRLAKPADRRLCVRPDGTLYRAALKSVPDPSSSLVAEWVEQLAPGYRLDPLLVLAVIRAESNFNPKALSAKNAQGLMQLIPATAKRFEVENPWDPLQNIHGGMRYLRWLLDYFDGNEVLALAGYNAGEGAVTRYKGVPPYAETRAYVRRVSLLRKPPRAALPGSS